MSPSTLIILNIAAASALVVALAALMLAPTRLRRHFAEGHTDRQKSALRDKQRAEVAQQRRRPDEHRHDNRDLRLRPIQDV